MPTLSVWNRCNNRCIMCSNPLYLQKKELSFMYSYQEIISHLISLKERGCRESFHLTGGEPTLHPDIFKILGFISREFPGQIIYLISNGRMFFYEEFVERILSFNDLVLEISILGHNSELHDRVTQVPGSFEQTVSGIKNIIKRKKNGQKLELRIVLNKLNYAYLYKIIEFINNELSGIDILVVIFPEPEGRCAAYFDNAGVTYSEVRDIICDAALNWKDKFKDFRLYHFPLCTMDRGLWPYLWVTQEPEEVDHPRKCLMCKVKDCCCGIHKNYIKIVGDKEFISQDKKIELELNQEANKKFHPILEVL